MNRYELKQYMHHNGITYEEVAARSGLHKTTVGEFLNGKANPPVRTIEKIFAAIGLDVKDFEDAPLPSKFYNLEEWKRRKKELHLRFEDISKQSGIPMSTVQDLFQGRTRSPRIDTVNAIARVLGLQKPVREDASVAANSSLVLTDKESRLLWAFKELVPTMQDYILEMTEKLVESQNPKKASATDSKRA